VNGIGDQVTKRKNLLRGVVAGIAGGLAAAWMMNQLAAVARQEPQQAMPDEEEEKAPPIAHYAFGVVVGGAYGGVAEYTPAVRSGFGTGFGGFLSSTADQFAVPVFKLASSPFDLPASAQASPIAGHIVYGVTTELVRRIVRRLL
jgi:uncharacterized membrane protein YagU involved in acid resistance